MTRARSIADTITVHVPFRIVKRGGRKELHLPDGAGPSRRNDNTLVKALARAFRWKRMLETGEFTTIAELAAREGIAPTYMSRVLRLMEDSPQGLVFGVPAAAPGPGEPGFSSGGGR